VWTIPDLNLVMIPISPGMFTMGSPANEQGRNDNESPQTRVTITKAFWLGMTEVTQREWQAVMGTNPSFFKGDDLPVQQVSWDEAMAFCQKLTSRERAAGRLPEVYAYMLPTEAQWEYACRAGTRANYAGNLSEMGWYRGNSGNTGTHAVATKRANAWGLRDMHGNVYEWCADWYTDKLAGEDVLDPIGAVSGSNCVTRGGGWPGTAQSCRSGWRFGGEPDYRNFSQGFRLALSSIR